MKQDPLIDFLALLEIFAYHPFVRSGAPAAMSDEYDSEGELSEEEEEEEASYRDSKSKGKRGRRKQAADDDEVSCFRAIACECVSLRELELITLSGRGGRRGGRQKEEGKNIL